MAQEESGAQLYPQQERERIEDDDDEEEDTEAKVKAPSFYSDAQKYWKVRSFILSLQLIIFVLLCVWDTRVFLLQ